VNCLDNNNINGSTRLGMGELVLGYEWLNVLDAYLLNQQECLLPNLLSSKNALPFSNVGIPIPSMAKVRVKFWYDTRRTRYD
jgi:hypothetical protein